VSVEVATSFPERFRPGLRLLCRRAAETRPLIVAAVRPHGDRWLVRFEGVDGPEQAGNLAGAELLVPISEAHPAPEGFYYSHRVAGWRCEDRAGTTLGAVSALEQTASGPMLTIQTPDGRAVLIPFVAAIVVEMDETGHRVVLDPPAGLFEL
jgi:16S rRNA processing protein RimM